MDSDKRWIRLSDDTGKIEWIEFSTNFFKQTSDEEKIEFIKLINGMSRQFSETRFENDLLYQLLNNLGYDLVETQKLIENYFGFKILKKGV